MSKKRKATDDWGSAKQLLIVDLNCRSEKEELSSGQTVYLHEFILAKHSKLFEYIQNDISTLTLKVAGGFHIFSYLIDYMYSGYPKDLDAFVTPLLHVLAYKYDVRDLVSACHFWWVDECLRSGKTMSKDNPVLFETGLKLTLKTNLVTYLHQVYTYSEAVNVFSVCKQVVDDVLKSKFIELPPLLSLLEMSWAAMAIQVYDQVMSPRGVNGLPAESCVLHHGDVISFLPNGSCTHPLVRLYELVLGSIPDDGILMFLKFLQNHEKHMCKYLHKPFASPSSSSSTNSGLMNTLRLADAAILSINSRLGLKPCTYKPMSALALQFVKDSRKRSQSRDRLSVTHTVAALSLIKLSFRSLFQPILSISNDSFITGLSPFIGPKMKISVALQLLSLLVKMTDGHSYLSVIEKKEEPLQFSDLFIPASLTHPGSLLGRLDFFAFLTPKPIESLSSLSSYPKTTMKRRLSNHNEFSKEDEQEFYRQTLQSDRIKDVKTILEMDFLFLDLKQKTGKNKLMASLVLQVSKYVHEILYRDDSGSVMHEFSTFIAASNEWEESLLPFLLGSGLTRFSDEKLAATITKPKDMPIADEPLLCLTSPKTYQEICNVLLRKAIQNHKLRPSLETEDNLWLLLRSIEFHRYASHDDSFSILKTLHSQLLNDDKPKQKALLFLVQHKLVFDHYKLSITTLKEVGQESWIPKDFVKDVLMMESREKAIMDQRKTMDREKVLLMEDSLKGAIRVGHVIDVSDVLFWGGQWCPAEVLETKFEEKTGEDMYLVKFIGFETRYNRWIGAKTHCDLFAPLGTHTLQTDLLQLAQPPALPVAQPPLPAPPLPGQPPLPAPLPAGQPPLPAPLPAGQPHLPNQEPGLLVLMQQYLEEEEEDEEEEDGEEEEEEEGEEQ